MTILGIDPSIACTGYGVIAVRNGKLSAEGFGVVKSTSSQSLHKRLDCIYDGIVDIIRTYQPDHIAIEDIFYSKNIRSTLTIGQARGVAILASVKAGVDISEYAPREVKKAVVGSGAASKSQVQFMVRKLLSLKDETMNSDSADALAIALCHAHRIEWEKVRSESK